MTKNKNKTKNKKSKYNINNINDFTKKGIYESLFMNMYIFDYKFIIYWLPIILYIIFISLYIVASNDDSEFSVGFISALLVYIIYFIIDVIYQTILCKKTSLTKKIYNSSINSITPALFVLIGYIVAFILRDVRRCDYLQEQAGLQQTNSSLIRNDQLYNIHRNNIICAIIFYIFSIFYSNPLNKKKCITNKLC